MFTSTQFVGSDLVSMESALQVDLTKTSDGLTWLPNQCFEMTFAASYSSNFYKPFDEANQPTCLPVGDFTMACNVKPGQPDTL